MVISFRDASPREIFSVVARLLGERAISKSRTNADPA
jgi:hypothetical protein